MSTPAAPETALPPRRVYCQNREVAAELSRLGPEFDLLDLPDPFPGNERTASVVIGDHPSVFTPALQSAIGKNRVRLLYVLGEDHSMPAEAEGIPVFGFLSRPLHGAVLASTVAAAFDHLRLAAGETALRDELDRTRTEIDELNAIGISLSTARDTAALLDVILRKSREITHSDAGSLYLAEEPEDGEWLLRFKLTQNDSLTVPFTEFTIPVDGSSIAGYVALTGEALHMEDVYQLPATLPYRFNPQFDQDRGYRTRSMLVVPMKNPQEEIIGVLQLINCKRDPAQRIDAQTVSQTVIPYPENRRALVSSLASQAAVAIENNRLYENIQTLFEGFVKASVTAIESRDPSTSGHSFRVADLTVGLAETVDRADSAHLRDITFSRSEMKEIRYASLLHDFGKVGVREEVLVKAKKLYPMQIDLVRQRFDYVRKAAEQSHTERRIAYLLEKGREEYLGRLPEFDRELQNNLAELDDYFQFLSSCNEPTVLPEGDFRRLTELAATRFEGWDGKMQPLISEDEARLLSIPKGSLDDSERKQIESHVVHTFNFLSQIPWTREIRNIPLIARAHHEKLDGTGYPFHLSAPEIPLQSRMMTISDIYDALSASDRPYKKAVPTERALDILRMESNQNLIDKQLFEIFVEAEIYKKTHGWKHPALPY